MPRQEGWSMNVFDQAAHVASLLERDFVLGRVLELAALKDWRAET